MAVKQIRIESEIKGYEVFTKITSRGRIGTYVTEDLLVVTILLENLGDNFISMTYDEKKYYLYYEY